MHRIARYFSLLILILGIFALSGSSVFAANGKPLSDLQLDDSRLNDDDIVCWSLEENDPRLGADERPFFVLMPGTDIAKSERGKKAFYLTNSKNGKKTDNLVALIGNEVPSVAKKFSDIPFAPEVLEISRPARPNSSGMACAFVGGPRKRARISGLIDSLEDGGQGPGTISRRFRRGSDTNSNIRRTPGYKFWNRLW